MFRTGIGIDISDEHVRMALVNRRGIPKGVYEVQLPKGFIVDDAVKDSGKLLKQLESFMNDAGIQSTKKHPTTLLVPESRVFTASFVLPADTHLADLEEDATMEAQRTIPIPFRDAIVEVVSGVRSKEGRRVTVFAAHQDILEGLALGFSIESLSIMSAESNNLALMRLFSRFGHKNLHPRSLNELLVIVDIGSVWTNITVYDKINTVVLSRSVERGHPQSICETLKEIRTYFVQKGFKVPVILLAGVSGADPKLDAACKKVMPKVGVYHIGEVIRVPGTSSEHIHAFGAAIGAGMRAANPKAYKSNHNFLRE